MRTSPLARSRREVDHARGRLRPVPETVPTAVTETPLPAAGLRILIVDDSPDDAELIVAALELDGIAVVWRRVDGEEAMSAALREQPWDIVLCDHTMPRFGSSQALRVLARQGRSLPTIVVSGSIGEEATVAAVKAGAVDFVSKDHLVRLGTAVRRALDESAQAARRHRLEQELADARRMEAVGQVAGGVAHELNNKLAVILGYTDRLARGLGAAHPLQATLAEVSTAAQASATLVRNLLAFARRQAIAPEPTVIGELVLELRRLLAPALGPSIEILVRDDSGGARSVVDGARLTQALVSLALNARDAMPGGGRLTIAVSALGAGGAAGTVRISVADTGSGMPDAIRGRVFEPFFTTKEPGEGTGLGLAAVQGTIAQIGGTISVSSQLGAGTTFVIDLPALVDPAQPSGGGPGAAGGALSVLVVEDDESVRELVEVLLRDFGHRVLTAPDASRGLAILSTTGTHLDVLVTDGVLPDGRGSELAARAAALHARLGVVCVTGYGPDVWPAEDPPPHVVVRKPFTPAELETAVRAVAGAR